MNKKLLLLEYDAGYVETLDKISETFLIESANKSEDLSKNGVPLIVFAVLQKYGVLNENNRIYSEEILKREAARYLKYCIPQKNTLLEANHPESTQINILNGAGLLIDCWWEGATLLGKIKLNVSKGFIESGFVSTSGDHIANLMMNEVRVGVSSRGVGSLKKINSVNIVQDDYELLCWDFVNKPSSKGSWVSDNLKSLEPFIDRTIKEQTHNNNNMPLSNRLSNFLERFK